MGKYCLICKSKRIVLYSLTFYRFPTDVSRLRAWCDALKLNPNNLPKCSYICSGHFAPDQICRKPGGRTYITSDAVLNVQILPRPTGSCTRPPVSCTRPPGATTLVGIKTLREIQNFELNRIWWFLVFCLTLAACVIAIREVYQKWIRSPVIVSFSTKETPIYSIPFPAVTICPESKTYRHLYNHTKLLRKHIENVTLTKEEKSHLDFMGLICDPQGLAKLPYDDVISADIYKKLDEMTIHTQFLSCSYMGEYKKCKDIFKPIITDEGICYTFNMLDRSEIFKNNVQHYSDFHKSEVLTYKNWTIDDGYSENAGLYTYPHRALLNGAKNALKVLLRVSKRDIDYTCKGSLQGFKVSLHIPTKVPRPSEQYFRVPLNEAVLAAIKPDMITTSTSVKMYNPKRRECYFPNEKQLKYFKIYTSSNCQLECLTNYTLYYCGCVNYFMPRDNVTQLCGIGSLECMKYAEHRLQLGDLRKKINANDTRRRSGKFRFNFFDCNCMPICSDITYHVETSQSTWDWSENLKARRTDGRLNAVNETNDHLSMVLLFFKTAQFKTSQRHELYGPTDFLANFGGLLGLFTGFSVLSLMEAIYFLTVRLCCNCRLYGYWAGPDK